MGKYSKYSKYHGVTKWARPTGDKKTMDRAAAKPWMATLWHNGAAWNSSRFATEREAAIAYDTKVLELGLDKPLNILKPKTA